MQACRRTVVDKNECITSVPKTVSELAICKLK